MIHKVELGNNNYLNFGSYEEMKKLAKDIKGLLCPITKGKYLDNNSNKIYF